MGTSHFFFFPAAHSRERYARVIVGLDFFRKVTRTRQSAGVGQVKLEKTVKQYMMLKKRSTEFSPKKNQGLRRVVECLFLSHAGPKSGCLSYLIVIMRKETSDVS